MSKERSYFSWPRSAGKRVRKAAKSGAWLRQAQRWILGLLLIVLAGPPAMVLIYRVLPPPVTPLMIIRGFDGYGLEREWASLARISSNLQRAVVAAEDAKFCDHNGFDWEAMDKAMARYRKSRAGADVTIRGASTITMQAAKNLLLWPGRNFLRKGAEAYVTFWLELLLPKQRILELYLNVIEWGPGIYGAEAASRHYFGIPAAQLSAHQSSLLAAVLPNPLRWKPVPAGPWTSERAGTISARMGSVPWSRQDGICP